MPLPGQNLTAWIRCDWCEVVHSIMANSVQMWLPQRRLDLPRCHSPALRDSLMSGRAGFIPVCTEIQNFAAPVCFMPHRVLPSRKRMRMQERGPRVHPALVLSAAGVWLPRESSIAARRAGRLLSAGCTCARRRKRARCLVLGLAVGVKKPDFYAQGTQP